MVQRKLILGTLTRQRLLELVAEFDIPGLTGARKDEIVATLGRKRQPATEDLLAQLYRDELKAICEAAGLDASGRQKQVIIDRLLGREQAEPPLFTTSNDDEAALATTERGTGSTNMNDTPNNQPASDTGPATDGQATKRRGRKQKQPANGNGSSGSLGFEAQLWQAADKLRGHMDASEYKHVVLGLIFLKYISDAFQVTYNDLAARQASDYTDPEDRDEYAAKNTFWVPPEARWSELQKNAKQPSIGKLIDQAMEAIERENTSLKGVLPKDYARPQLDKHRLGELIGLISTITLREAGDDAARSRDILGRVYEYFLGMFAEKEGKSGGEFYTPQSVVKLLVEMIEPYKGRVFDPCCGSGGMFVQSEKFVEQHGGRIGDIAIYGQESNYTTWRLAKMNLAIRQIDANLGPEPADSFHRDLHPDLKADYVLANPPSTTATGAATAYAKTSAGSSAHRRPATRTTPGFSTSSTTSPPPAPPASSWPTARCPATSPAKARSASASSKPTWSIASSPCRANSSTPPASPSASGSSPATRRTTASVTGRARRCSSTPGRWGTWSTAPTANHPTRKAHLLKEWIRQVRGGTVRLLEAAPEKGLRWRPLGTSNPILWHAGHALWLLDHFCVCPLAGDTELPVGWETLFASGSDPTAPASPWPSREAMADQLRRQAPRAVELLDAAGRGELPMALQDREAQARFVRALIHGVHDEARHQGEMFLLLKLYRNGAPQRK